MKMNIPGLHGGISQQSPLLRMPNQHESVVNTMCDVVDGLRFPRPGTNLIRSVYGVSTEGLLGHIRTTDDKLWAIYRNYAGGADNIVALEVSTGTSQVIDVSANDYLKYGADLRLISILDTVFLMNRNIPVTVEQVIEADSAESVNRPYALTYVEQAYETLDVYLTASVVTGLATTELPTLGEQLELLEMTITVGAGVTDPSVVSGQIYYALNGTYIASSVDYSTGLVVTSPASARVTHGGNLYRVRSTHTSGATSEPGVGGSWATYWQDLGATPATGTYNAWVTATKYYHEDELLEARVELHLSSQGQHPVTVFSALNEVDPLNATEGKQYYVTKAPSYEELPPSIPVDPSGFFDLARRVTFKISDGYFVKYITRDSAYEECPAPGQTYKLTNTTLPYVLEYASGTWSVSTGDWGDFPRAVGDNTSAKVPDFVGRTLNDMFYYRGRLCFLSDNYVVMSRVNFPYDFFPQTATEVLDDDPISVFPSSLDYHELHWAKPFSKQLMLFSGRKQYVLHSGFEALTPKTVAIDEATSMHLLKDVEPVFLESSMLLAEDNGDFMGVTEFKLMQQETATDGMELTESIPRLIPSTYDRMTYVPGVNVALVSKRGESTVYCYKFHRQMDGQLTQVAWTTWEFPFPVVDIRVFESDKVWILLDKGYVAPFGNATVFTSMNLSEGYDAIPLDLRFTATGVTSDQPVSQGPVVIDTDTYKSWDGVVHPDPGVAKNITQGYAIESTVELSPLVLRDDKGLPRADISATIANMQVDWVGGELSVQLVGQGLPTRTIRLTPIEYTSESCDAGASYREPRPTRVLVMYPASRVTITLNHTGTRCTRVNNIAFNLDVIKDWG